MHALEQGILPSLLLSIQVINGYALECECESMALVEHLCTCEMTIWLVMLPLASGVESVHTVKWSIIIDSSDRGKRYIARIFRKDSMDRWSSLNMSYTEENSTSLLTDWLFHLLIDCLISGVIFTNDWFFMKWELRNPQLSVRRPQVPGIVTDSQGLLEGRRWYHVLGARRT